MLVALSDATVAFGENEVLQNITAKIHEKDRIGLIGNNGAGKTTLVKAILGELPLEKGTIVTRSGITIGYLAQNSTLNAAGSVIEEMRSVFADARNAQKRMTALESEMKESPDDPRLQKEYAAAQSLFEASGGYIAEVEIKKVLTGMGFSPETYQTPVSALSGGEKTRLEICRLLLIKPDLLLLDEPTNHLDFATLAWLEEYLSSVKSALLIISHDRYFLDKLVRRIWEIEDAHIEEYTGNYSEYKVLKQQRISNRLKEYEKQSRQVEHMEDYVAKNLTRASTAKSAQSRIKKLNSMQRIAKPKTKVKTPKFVFRSGTRPGLDVLTVRQTKLYAGKRFLADVEMEVKRGEKAAVIGANGTGKSTLMKRLYAASMTLDPDIAYGKNADVGYYDQENKNLNANKTALDQVRASLPALSEYQARSLLGGVLITGEEVYKRIGDLSGGERAKVGLALLTGKNSNVLLLDEPTNHLDLHTRESLESALKEYDGTLLFVSHDRYFINALADRIYGFSNEELRSFEGNFDAYSAFRENEQQSQAAEEPAQKKELSGKNPKARRAAQAKKRERILTIERKIEENEREQKALHRRIEEDPSDFETVGECCEKLNELKVEYERLSQQWEEEIE